MIQEDDQLQNEEGLSLDPEQDLFETSPFVREILPYGCTYHIGDEPVFGNEGDAKMKESSVIENAQKYIKSYRDGRKRFLSGLFDYKFMIIPFETGVLLRADFVKAAEAKIEVTENILTLEKAVELSQMPEPSGNLKEKFIRAVKENCPPNNEGSFIYLNGDQTYIIKGLDDKFWTSAAAKQDDKLIFNTVTSCLSGESNKSNPKKNENNWLKRFFKK